MGFMEFVIIMEEHIKPLLVKLGLVLALCFGFLFARRSARRSHPFRFPSLQSFFSYSGSYGFLNSGGNKIDLDGSFVLENYVEALQEANEGLRKENKELAKEIDRLEANQCAFIEEQVYLKWVNACLRYEVRNYKAPPGKTMARDLNNNMSPRSHEKAKQLILEYSNSEEEEEEEDSNKNDINSMDFESGYWSSSQTFSKLADSINFDDSSVDVCSTMKTRRRWNKVKILSRVKRLLVLQKSHYHSSSMGSITTSYNAAGEKRNRTRRSIGKHGGKM